MVIVLRPYRLDYFNCISYDLIISRLKLKISSENFNMLKSLQLIFVALLVGLNLSLAFRMQQTRASISALRMGGGRSVAEKDVTTRSMFKQLRSKFNEAAKKPGFFEVGDGPADLDLYCKSNTDGTQIGDCPFAQFIQVYFYR